MGDAVARQVKIVFGGKVCDNAPGHAAFLKLITSLRTAANLDTSVDAEVLSSPIANAFALPGGSIYLMNGLLGKAENADEIAGVLAHELGHLKHRDSVRNLIYNGGTSFLIGLLFGDITGSSALIFTSRTLLSASYSRDVEWNADTMSIDLMHHLGRPTKPMGELLVRVTGNHESRDLSFLASHPLAEDRLVRMNKEDRQPSGAPLLTPQEWSSLKAICGAKS
jgi:predicted Zn-dependent protease